MQPVYKYLVPCLWFIWCLYWLISAGNVKAAVRMEGAASRAAHVIPLAVAGILLASPNLPASWLYVRFVEWTPLMYFLGAGLAAGGLAFAIWARWVLGRNWSGTVTLKQDHELIRGGPYRCVRHPIYSGLLLGILGTTIAQGQWRGLLALAIVFVAFWGKLRREERWLAEIFGAEYAAYRNEVAALIPFVL
jgi:protein-S-isoprenylcysteine O-methyltransferase Ste14